MRTPHKKKSDKSRKNFEDGCKSCNCPSLKCAYNEIERAEIRMGPNDRRNRIIELLIFRRHETLDNLAHEFGVSRYTIMRDIVQARHPNLQPQLSVGRCSTPPAGQTSVAAQLSCTGYRRGA